MVLGGRREEHFDCAACVIENLWTPMDFESRRMENVDCLAFFVESLWKPMVSGSRRGLNVDCIDLLFEHVWKPMVSGGRRLEKYSLFAWTQVKINVCWRSKNGTRWLYRCFAWTPIRTYAFCVHAQENLWKPCVLENRMTKSYDCNDFLPPNQRTLIKAYAFCV